jgi:hypothetical protein
MEGAAAYTHLTTPQDTLSSVAQYWGGIEAQKRAREESYKREDLKTARGIQEKEEAYLLPVQTGHQASNRAIMKFTESDRERVRSNHRQIDALFSQGKNQQARELQLENKRIIGGLASAKDFFTNAGGILSDYVTNIDKYDPYDKRMRDILDAFTRGQYDFSRTSSGMPQVTLYNRKEDGSIEEIKVSEEDLMNGFKPASRFDAFTSFEEIGKGLGIHKQDTDTGLKIKTVKDISPQAKESLDIQIEQVLNDPSKARQAYAELLDKVKEDGILNDNQKKELRTALERVALGVVNTEETLKTDTSESIKLRREELNNKQKEAKDLNLVYPTPIIGTDKSKVMNTDTLFKGQNEGKPDTNENLSGFTIKGGDISLSGNKKEIIKGIYVTDSNKVYISSDILDKGGIPKEVKGMGLVLKDIMKDFKYEASDETVQRLAQKMYNPNTKSNFKTAEELVTYLQGKEVKNTPVKQNLKDDEEYQEFLRKIGLN